MITALSIIGGLCLLLTAVGLACMALGEWLR